MKQLTELKDGQKVLIAYTIKKDDSIYPFNLMDNNGDSVQSVTNSLKIIEEDEHPQEIYDFNEVMDSKKSEPISEEDFFIKVQHIFDKNRRLAQFEFHSKEDLYDLFQSYHPFQEQKSEPIREDEFYKKIEEIFDKELLLGSTKLKKPLFDLFTSYHPESFTPEVGNQYEFSCNGSEWYKRKLHSFYAIDQEFIYGNWTHIRPIQQSDEELKAIELLKNLGYKIEK